MLTDETPIFKDTYDLTETIFKISNQFPHQYKYTVGQRLLDTLLDMTGLIFEINRHSNKSKSIYIEKYINKYQQMKVLWRLSNDLKIISQKIFIRLQPCIENIGRQIYGIKKQNSKYISLHPESDILRDTARDIK